LQSGILLRRAGQALAWSLRGRRIVGCHARAAVDPSQIEALRKANALMLTALPVSRMPNHLVEDWLASNIECKRHGPSFLIKIKGRKSVINPGTLPVLDSQILYI
jgi:hypothetical protein